MSPHCFTFADRVVWEEDQISVLLDLWRKPSIGRQIAEPSTRYKKVYKTIAKRITAITACSVSESQVKSKMKEMKIRYKMMRERLENGLMERWSCYDDMCEIMMREYTEEGDDEDDEEEADDDEHNNTTRKGMAFSTS